MEEKLFEIKEKYTFEEHLAFNKIILRKSKSNILLAILIIMVLCLGIFLKKWFYILYAILLPIIFYMFIKFRIKKSYENNKAVKDMDMTIEFYPSKIIQTTNISSYTLEHDKIYKVIETKTHFYIMPSENQGLFVKKENISKELEEHIRSLMNNWHRVFMSAKK